MKNLEKTRIVADQSDNHISKVQKHDVNLRKNSTLYFQVGLIICLLGVYALFEMNFKTTPIHYETMKWEAKEEQSFNTNIIIETTKEKSEVLKKPVAFKNQKIEVVEDDNPDVLLQEFSNSAPNLNPIDIGHIDNIKKVTEEIDPPFNMINVEKVPVYPGCEDSKDNEDRRKCMSEKLTKLIQKRFNTEAGNGYGLSGIQKIAVQFTIDENGRVKDIMTRAPNKNLEIEATRVMQLIPRMTPAMQRDQPVKLIYQLPITFKIKD